MHNLEVPSYLPKRHKAGASKPFPLLSSCLQLTITSTRALQVFSGINVFKTEMSSGKLRRGDSDSEDDPDYIPPTHGMQESHSH